MSEWKLETAKARLSEVVRQAKLEGPQTITVRGTDAAVVLSAGDYRRLIGTSGPDTWVDRFRAAFTGDIDLVRDSDGGRDLDLDL
jgi:prevent-host-death family protein